jgi:hypothetical protein
LLHFGVCYKLLASQVLNGAKEMKVVAREIWTVERLVHLLAAIVPQPLTSPVVSMDPRDFNLF